MCGVVASCFFSVARPQPAEARQDPSTSPYAGEIAEAGRFYHDGKTGEAERRYRDILQKADHAHDDLAEAEAHLGLGGVAARQASYDRARTECEEALSLFNSLHDSRGVARVQECFGNIAWQLGDNKTANRHYTEALKEFDTAGLLREKAALLINLAFATDGYPERIKLDTEALEIARQVGDRRIEGQALHGIGQWLFVQGDSEGAEQRYEEAEALLDHPEDRIALARVLLSEGRLQRAHGEIDRAIALYGRGLKMAEETGDKQGSVQIMNAMGASYGDAKRYREALGIFQRAYDLSKDMNAPPMTEMLRQNIAESYIDLGEYQQGADILEEMNRRTPDPFPYSEQFRDATLAKAYERLERYDAALALATRSVERARAHKNEIFLSEPLMLKAHVEQKLGQSEAALADAREALNVIETLRARLVPADFMKRGFADKTQEAFAYSVELLQGMNQPEQGLEVAEQARSRAFLDLLAARGIRGVEPGKTSDAPSVESSAADRGPSGALTTRGESTGGLSSSKDRGAMAGPHSPVSAAAPSVEQMVEIARRLDSTILSYWVLPDATYIWVLTPSGRVYAARADISAARLSRMVKATWSLGGAETRAGAGGTGGRAMHSRGGGTVFFGDSPKRVWSELSRVLIQPVRDALPPRGSRLTIVPHGPLFLLSFAALLDRRGRYLTEDYALSYTPSLGVLQYTGALKETNRQARPRFLLVADPLLSSGLANGTSLPPLPNARLEVQGIARLFPSATASTLIAAAATKDAVREQVAGKSVLHFATHAIVRDDQPFDSFLALSGGAGKRDAGHLTVQEIYGLNLQADLVVLSACRTALGKVSGDGMLGLTRAFFYAGASSVMATLWDVADEPTYLLISEFYKDLRAGQDKAAALRSAQLHLLRELRAGRVKVNTSAGEVTLPERPVFWAGFALQGEP
jgi:CHAT domain-containing protein/tetratricopeptide (TPR) repeat protein